MKKYLSIVLALVVVISLCACSRSSEKRRTVATDGETTFTSGDEGLRVGFGRVNITPDYSVPLAGYGNTSMRMSDGFQTYLYSTCVAYSDGKNTLLMFQNDLTYVNPAVVGNVRTEITEKYGVPGEYVMIAATHNHSAPDINNTAEPNIGKYNQDLKNWMVEAAGLALEDLKLVTGMYYGSTNPEGLNFVRHYTTEAGVYKGDNFNDLCTSPINGHTHDADNQLQVVKITRKDAEDVVLVNWQTHPHRGGGGANLSITADLVGILIDHVEKETGSKAAYYTGAAGNVNPSSRIGSENITADYREQGEALGKHAVDVLEGELTELAMGKVQVVTTTYTGDVNHTEDHLLEVAYEVSALWKETNDFIKCVTLANSYGLNSPYHADCVIGKAGMERTFSMDIAVCSVGDLGFAIAPFEMFDENGVYIKERSPFAVTFVVELCNGSLGYIPSEEGYRINCYEANTGKFVPGTGEIVAQEYVKLLEGLYATK